HAEGQRVADLAHARDERVGDAAAIGALVTEERYEVAHAGIADAEYLRARRLVPQLVDLDWVKLAARRQQADRALVDEFPFRARQLPARVAFPLAHGEARLLLVERGRGVGEAADAAVARRACA